MVGLPGSDKTTLADALVASLLQWHADWTDHRTDRISDPDRPWIGSHVAHVPMDGFHLADVDLNRLGRADRKGAPDTFDAAGYAALLQRLRHSDDDVWAPAFDRTIEQPIAGSIPVLKHTRVVITEGNYLLLKDPVWAQARCHIDTVWFTTSTRTSDASDSSTGTYGSENLRPRRWPGSTAPINATPTRSAPPATERTSSFTTPDSGRPQ